MGKRPSSDMGRNTPSWHVNVVFCGMRFCRYGLGLNSGADMAIPSSGGARRHTNDDTFMVHLRSLHVIVPHSRAVPVNL